MKSSLEEMLEEDEDLNHRANLELMREFDEDFLVSAVRSLDPIKILSLRFGGGSEEAQEELCGMLREVISKEAYRIRSEGIDE